jgi:SPP1 gp7 family putative phage head morphogenesis protein
VAWQREAVKGRPSHAMEAVPARVAFPLLRRLALADEPHRVRAAFDPAFTAAKAPKAIDLDRWWDDYVNAENEVADAYRALWDEMLGALIDALVKLQAGSTLDDINAVMERIFAEYDDRHYAVIEPHAVAMFEAGAALGSDQVELAAADRLAAKALPPQPPTISILWNLVNERGRDWARQNAGRRITYVTRYTRERSRDLIARRMAGGMTFEELVEELQQVRRSPDDTDFRGIFGRKRAELIAQTESTHALDGGQEAGWRVRGVRYSQWHTAGDGYVCPLCRALNGKVAAIGEPFVLEPSELARLDASQRAKARAGIRTVQDTHPGCRCIRRPYLPVQEPNVGEDAFTQAIDALRRA